MVACLRDKLSTEPWISSQFPGGVVTYILPCYPPVNSPYNVGPNGKLCICQEVEMTFFWWCGANLSNPRLPMELSQSNINPPLLILIAHSWRYLVSESSHQPNSLGENLGSGPFRMLARHHQDCERSLVGNLGIPTINLYLPLASWVEGEEPTYT